MAVAAPLCFVFLLCAASLLAGARVIPSHQEAQAGSSVQAKAGEDSASVSRWAQIQKMAARLESGRLKKKSTANSQLVAPLPTVSSSKDETMAGKAKKSVHRRSVDQCPTTPTSPQTSTHSFASNGLGGVLEVKWVGEPYEDYILALLEDVQPTNLYFSSDGGQTFQPAAGVTEPIQGVYISDVNPSYVYAISAADDTKSTYALFVSINGGQTFVACTVTEYFAELLLHPTRPDRFLGLSPDTVSLTENDDDSTVDVSAVYSFENVTQFAATATSGHAPTLPMTLVDTDVLTVDYFRPSPEMMKCKASTVYYTKIADQADYDSEVVFLRSEHPYGLGAPKLLLNDAFHYEQVHQYIFVMQFIGNPEDDNLQLQVSTDMGVTFQLAQFPFEGEQRLFSFIDGTEDLSMISVQQTVAQKLGNCQVVLQGSNPVNLTAVSSDFTPIPNMSAPAELFGNNILGCDPSQLAGATGKIVVLNRGGCGFYDKINNAYAAGAVGVVVINHENEYTTMGVPAEVDPLDYPPIPAFLVPVMDRNTLQSHVGQNALLIESDIEEEDLFDTAVLYVSGPDGVHYTTALTDIVDFGTYGNALVDVYKVESSNSTYIANYMDNGQLVTVITFDKGSYWQRLPATCEQACNLTVVLPVGSSMQPLPIPGPRSAPGAPGLIIVNGYASTTLEGFEPDLDTIDTYWSKDGGHTWTLIQNGASDFRILDHGGIVVVIPYGVKTQDVLFSVYPQPLQSVTVFPTEQYVSGVVTEPGSPSRYAFLYSMGKNSWNGVRLDFTSTLPSLCQSEDYEPFNTLNDSPQLLPNQPACLDGRAVTYQHRKTCSLCYNGPQFNPVVSSTICQCSERDFQCYPGFVRAYPVDNYTSICARDVYYAIDGHCASGQTVFDVPRYRVIPGDVCTPTAEQLSGMLAPKPMPCTMQSRKSSGLSHGLIAFVVLFVLVVSSVLVVVFALVVSPTFRNKFARAVGMGDSQSCCVPRMLAHLKIFRPQHNYQYSVLAQEEQRDLAHAESDDDDLLFGIGDAQLVTK